MLIQSNSIYEILGIDRDADTKTIKKSICEAGQAVSSGRTSGGVEELFLKKKSSSDHKSERISYGDG